MVNFKNLWSSILALLLIGFFTACQTESLVEVHNTAETIAKNTPLTTFIERLVMQKTSQDNIIDHSNCFMIKFPYTITVNNTQITLNSPIDYQLVHDNINAYLNDNDIVILHFPITVLFNDYSEKSILSQMELNNLIQKCSLSSDDFGKINCVVINFPITLNLYDSNKQIASTISFNTNFSLYNFLENLEDNKFIAISYPITVTDSKNQNIIITTNSQFEDVIKNAVDTCPENAVTPHNFLQTLTSNSWKISYYYHDKEKTSIYDGYNFIFNSNYTVSAKKIGITYNGTWSTKLDNGVREFEIKFDSDPLKELDEGWKLFEFNNSQLRFNDKENSGEPVYLYFVKN